MSERIIITNAVIEKATFVIKPNGDLRFVVELNHGAENAGIGHFVMAVAANADSIIRRILTVAGVPSWDLLPGRPVRVKSVEEVIGVVSLGHFINDQWFGTFPS